jgi:type I restriction enzyme S subunit
MTFPRYEHLKDSGVEWLGVVPAHWSVSRLALIANILAGHAFDASLFGFEGIPVVRMSDFGGGLVHLEDVKRVDPLQVPEDSLARRGDILLGLSGSISNFAVVRECDLPIAINQRVAMVRIYEAQNSIVKWFLQSPEFINQLSSELPETTIQNISMGQLRRCKLPFPPLAEQARISAFLELETAKIDSLVDEQKRLVELLKEKRQAIIAHAVTKGLDPKMPVKNSKIEWLGEVPRHWEVCRLGLLFRETSDAGVDELPILSVSIHHGVSDAELDEQELDRKVSRSEDRSKYKRVQPGDLAYNMMRAWQGGFGAVRVRGMVSPAYVVARPIADFSTEYVERLLRTPRAVEEMRRRSHGVTDFRLRLYWEEFKSIHISLPPRMEQEQIVAAIEKEESAINELVAVSESSITLLQERRSAVISAAITGKIDVRGSVPVKAEAA